MSARGSLLVMAVATAANARTAAARPWDDFRGGGHLRYEASYAQTLEGPAAGLGLAGVHLRAFGLGRIGPAAGFDLAAGTTIPGGFAYDVALHLVGLGARLTDTSTAGITLGVGADGATGTVDDAATFPLEAWLELQLGQHLRVLARARVIWLAGAAGRDSGSPTAIFADTADATIALRLGRRWARHGANSGNGWFLGVHIREAADLRHWGLVLGHALDAGTV